MSPPSLLEPVQAQEVKPPIARKPIVLPKKLDPLREPTQKPHLLPFKSQPGTLPLSSTRTDATSRPQKLRASIKLNQLLSPTSQARTQDAKVEGDYEHDKFEAETEKTLVNACNDSEVLKIKEADSLIAIDDKNGKFNSQHFSVATMGAAPLERAFQTQALIGSESKTESAKTKPQSQKSPKRSRLNNESQQSLYF